MTSEFETAEAWRARAESAELSLIEARAQPDDRRMINAARAIGATMRMDNHMERAREVWRAFHINGEYPKP